jgi:hypothetical protein
MRKFTVAIAIMASLGVLAPLAANAAVGGSMYQPSPITGHAKVAQNKKFAGGRSVYNQQLQSIQSNRALR